MKCAKCRAELVPGERFCGECGQPVQVTAAPPTPASQVAVGACPKCGANLDPGKRFCSSCGYDLMADAPKPQATVTYPAVVPAQPVTARTSSRSFRIALIIGVVALVAIFLLGSVGIGLWIWSGGTRLTTASITGTWNCEFTAPGGPTERAQFVLVQSGSSITGTLANPEEDWKKAPLSGTFDGQKFSFKSPISPIEWQLALSPDGSSMKGVHQLDGKTVTLACTR